MLRISPHSVRMRENADQSNSEYGDFLRSEDVLLITLIFEKSDYETSYIFAQILNANSKSFMLKNENKISLCSFKDKTIRTCLDQNSTY